MIQRLVLAIAALAAVAAAAGVAIVAAAFAVYALLKPELGAAGSAGAVAAVFAVLIGLCALFAWFKVRPKTAPAGSGDTMARLVQLARERPVIAAGALIAGSLLAMRNPAITALVVKSFFDSKKPQKR